MKLLWAYGVRNVWSRGRTTALTVMGMGLVSFIFLSVLMLGDGLTHALIESGSPDNVLLLRQGATTEIASGLYRNQAHIIRSLPGIASDTDSNPMALAESVVLISLTKTGGETPVNVTVRGTQPMAFTLRPQVRVVEGRPWQPGTAEIVVGSHIAARFLPQGIGSSLRVGKRDWLVVGIMSADGTAFESEIWGDADLLMAAYGRESYSSLTLRLQDETAFEPLSRLIADDPRLMLQVKRERDYYREKSFTLATFIRVLGFTFTTIFSIGALLGGTMTMYGAVAARTREIGTLRALGFVPVHVCFVFLIESLTIGAAAGGLALCGGAALQFVTLSTMNFSTFAEVAFRLILTPPSAAATLGFSLLISLLGGLPPAIRAAHIPTVAALQAPGQ
ncbi:MAG: ABC transporter permease [Nitrospira sp.]|nr:ABC transporter permease [Nitrospira sp.]